ncbi:MAG TPA: DUF6607 family protein [Wenzhouxiangellaceae bacterium]|nr:DUF6607 family protein [Wenzhouxiangellaceae bacterium]
MQRLMPICILAGLMTAGCATTSTGTLEPEPQRADAASVAIDTAGFTAPAADRQAILAMAGEFDVDFAFDETVALVPGYERTEPKRSDADEVVLLIEDSGDRIVLQHLLIVGKDNVIKHWRQDWVFEADQRLEFSDDQTWALVGIPEDTTNGAWTQCVYGVADTPRYCGTGKWNHRYGHATWTSDRTWRPLPRREYTTREDYNALNVENRHTVTPEGWTHEQDNSKVVRLDGKTEQVLVREFGFNNYKDTSDFDFTPAYEYWDQTAEYWATVRKTWQKHFETGGVVVATDVDGLPVIEGLFELADRVREGRVIGASEIDRIFADYVRPIEVANVAAR